MVLCGSEDTQNALHERYGGYEHVAVAQELAAPTLDFLKFLDTVKPTSETGDWIDALVVATDMLVTHCKKKKYNKRVCPFLPSIDLPHHRRTKRRWEYRRPC